ncbi:acyl-CoA dehydrogenase family protein [Nannocystis pusilla]|uniref:acyl-CoA dehydrogenase family protein n=1 Tax=Nannocystis pusilla TaxID=889268 RepID=UPI003B78FAAA
MTRPHDFGFDETAQILKDTARRLLQDHCAPEALHRLVAASSEPARATEGVWDPSLWRKMVDLGWTAVAVPEHAGGFGMGLVAIAGLAEELGRAAVPSPLIATLCATYVAAACDSDAARQLLRRIASGLSVSLAGTDRRGSWSRRTPTSWSTRPARCTGPRGSCRTRARSGRCSSRRSRSAGSGSTSSTSTRPA